MKQLNNSRPFDMAGTMAFALRLIIGWTYFSAFWRRLILENKLDPDAQGYIGEKFNHFLPNALGIKPLIEYLVLNPESLWIAMLSFTIIEGIVGLLIILGVFTRLMSIGVLTLALGILLGSGWLGTTCLDEWQIGILGISAGFTIFLTGGGKYSFDEYMLKKNNKFKNRKWFRILASGALPFNDRIVGRVAFIGSLFIAGLTLFTNQYFHGGVYGKLHNLSVKPHIDITNSQIIDDTLSFTVFRDEGADVYGSFLINIKLIDETGNIAFEQTNEQLSKLSEAQIKNDYVAKVKAGKHSLILPLGARATISLYSNSFRNLSGNYTLHLVDISGETWKSAIKI